MFVQYEVFGVAALIGAGGSTMLVTRQDMMVFGIRSCNNFLFPQSQCDSRADRTKLWVRCIYLWGHESHRQVRKWPCCDSSSELGARLPWGVQPLWWLQPVLLPSTILRVWRCCIIGHPLNALPGSLYHRPQILKEGSYIKRGEFLLESKNVCDAVTRLTNI